MNEAILPLSFWDEYADTEWQPSSELKLFTAYPHSRKTYITARQRMISATLFLADPVAQLAGSKLDFSPGVYLIINSRHLLACLVGMENAVPVP